MKITTAILSIPPYISTTWKNISSLHARAEKNVFTLIVTLQNQVQIEVPDLDKEAIDAIFTAHAHYAKEPTSKTFPTHPIDGLFGFNLPLKAEGPIDAIGVGMEHNPEQANLAPIPPDVLKKIAMIAHAFGLEDTTSLPKGEPHCNCVYCQIARSLHGDAQIEPAEEVTAKDLSFRDWVVEQTADKLYTVTNPLDPNEHYTIFLGSPLGCTCGSKNCEHIRTVLNS